MIQSNYDENPALHYFLLYNHFSPQSATLKKLILFLFAHLKAVEFNVTEYVIIILIRDTEDPTQSSNTLRLQLHKTFRNLIRTHKMKPAEM